jgi:hypothetical protein
MGSRIPGVLFFYFLLRTLVTLPGQRTHLAWTGQAQREKGRLGFWIRAT